MRKGFGIALYPEGTIPPQTPNLIPFKDGAFRLSIEEGIPIVPITLPYNHKVLPITTNKIESREIKIVIHEPLNTKEKPYTDYKKLRDDTYEIIEQELKKHQVI